MTPASTSNDDCFFRLLPDKVLVQIADYLDIQAIGAVAQTSRAHNGSLSEIVTSENIWLSIVNVRFNIGNSKSCKPQLYGGRRWKDAYRSMSLCNRIPEMSVFFREKIVFAKGAGYLMISNEDNQSSEHKEKSLDDSISSICSIFSDDESMVGGRVVQTELERCKDQIVCMHTWVMINHTDDCHLRHTPTRMRHSENPNERRTDENAPYIELQLVFQNTKSKFSTLEIDVLKTTVAMMCKNGYDETSILDFPIIGRGPLKPKIIYRSIGSKVLYQDSAMKPNDRSSSSSPSYEKDDKKLYNYFHDTKDKSMSTLASTISLNPFECVVVSVNVPLKYYVYSGENLRFETDFLSRAISVCTPISLHVENKPNQVAKKNSVKNQKDSSILSVATFDVFV